MLNAYLFTIIKLQCKIEHLIKNHSTLPHNNHSPKIRNFAKKI